MSQVSFIFFFLISSYLSSAFQQQPEPHGGSLPLQPQSHNHHWFYIQPVCEGKLYICLCLFLLQKKMCTESKQISKIRTINRFYLEHRSTF